jgi:hypothetical protein
MIVYREKTSQSWTFFIIIYSKFLYFIREDYVRIKSIYHMIRHLQVSLLGGAAFSTRGASALPGAAIPLLICIVDISSLAVSCLTGYILITFC